MLAIRQSRDRLPLPQGSAGTGKIAMNQNRTASNPPHPPVIAGVPRVGRVGGFFVKMKTYSEKLKDPRWQRKRLEIMERDQFKCRHCRSTEKTLNVHHKVYRKGKMPWDYEDDVFVTLCEDCHKVAEEQKERVLLMMGRSAFVDDQIAFASELIGSNSTKNRSDQVKFLWEIPLSCILEAAKYDIQLEHAAPWAYDGPLCSISDASFSAIKAITSNVSSIEKEFGA